MHPIQSIPQPITRPLPQVDTRPRFLPPYHVVLENDPHHSFEFVIEVLRKVFGYEPEKAAMLTLEAHNSQQAVVWTGPREVAELRVEQITSFHEIRRRPFGEVDLGPLGCHIEPAPENG